MAKMSQLSLDTAPERLAETEHDLRYLAGFALRTSVGLGTLASKIGRLDASCGFATSDQLRTIVAELDYLAAELAEASRFEGL